MRFLHTSRVPHSEAASVGAFCFSKRPGYQGSDPVYEGSGQFARGGADWPCSPALPTRSSAAGRTTAAVCCHLEVERKIGTRSEF